MGRQELVAALQQKGEAAVKEIWQQAEAEVEQYRREKARQVDREKHVCGRESDRDSARECVRVEWETERTLRRLRLAGLQQLERRLAQLAHAELMGLSGDDRSAPFKRLAAEMPGTDWARAVVHPGDREIAEELYPGVQITTDADVSGGLQLESADAAVRIDNSFDRRIASSWPELVGAILAELEEGV